MPASDSAASCGGVQHLRRSLAQRRPEFRNKRLDVWLEYQTVMRAGYDVHRKSTPDERSPSEVSAGVREVRVHFSGAEQRCAARVYVGPVPAFCGQIPGPLL